MRMYFKSVVTYYKNLKVLSTSKVNACTCSQELTYFKEHNQNFALMENPKGWIMRTKPAYQRKLSYCEENTRTY